MENPVLLNQLRVQFFSFIHGIKAAVGVCDTVSEMCIRDSIKGGQCVKMDLFRRFGIIAAAGDRHLAEFMPGTEYLKDPETVQDWQFGLTTVASRKQVQMERMEKGEKLAAGKEQVEPVSYTHLDVYKRQGLPSWAHNSAR